MIAHFPAATWNEVTTKAGLDTPDTKLAAELRADFVEATNLQIEWLVCSPQRGQRR